MIKQVVLKEVEITTPDIDFLKLWLIDKDNHDVNNYVENLVREIIDMFESAEAKDIL